MEKLWTQANLAYYHDQLQWNVGLGIVLCAIVYVLLTKLSWDWRTVVWTAVPRRRGRAMRRARRNYVRSQTIDALVDFIEARVYSGEFTRKEASELYRDARKYWPVKDLFPSPELLKENIKKRLAAKIHEPALTGKVKPRHAFDKTVKA